MPYLLHSPYLYFICAVAISALLAMAAIPSILHVARIQQLYDDIGNFRKEHVHGIPRLGGIAIFVSFLITVLGFTIIDRSFSISYLLTASIVLFAMGLKDDLTGVNPSTKFFIQIIVALILVLSGNVRLTSMYGMFGIYEIPFVLSLALSTLVIILIINAFNLIDGIDGLAAVTGILANSVFAASFIFINQYELAVISLIMVGAIIGFLRYNLTPAKIFMGDTGSLLIGLVSVVMAIKLIELNKYGNDINSPFNSTPAFVIAILIGPIFDTLRVFFVRILNGLSPFTADRNHIHHRILRLGFTHLQTTAILACINILSIALVLLFNKLGNFVLVTLIFSICVLFNWVITFLLRTKKEEDLSVQESLA
jgi:UDP-N-acetylmuramyl pentapeptide phosphotransferase/UDP-N-acetylglucosamine-1-phosphate transferase